MEEDIWDGTLECMGCCITACNVMDLCLLDSYNYHVPVVLAYETSPRLPSHPSLLVTWQDSRRLHAHCARLKSPVIPKSKMCNSVVPPYI